MQLVDRGRDPARTPKRLEHISFRCTEDQALAVRQLAARYNTTVSDVLLQLVDIAARKENTNVPEESVEE